MESFREKDEEPAVKGEWPNLEAERLIIFFELRSYDIEAGMRVETRREGSP